MARRSLFCTVCGVTIEPTSIGNLGADARLQWYQELRAVSRELGLTGVGYTTDCSRFTGPLDPSRRHDDEDLELAALHLLSAGPGEYPNFPVHAGCWQLMLQYFSPVDEEELARLLYDWYHCTTWSRHRYPRPGHDFGGAAQFQMPGSVMQKMRIAGYAYLVASPLDFTAKLREASGFRESPEEISTRAGILRADPFLSLPPEIVHYIFVYLSLTEIQSFVCASSWVARCFSPGELPQFFWRSRFRRGYELDFAFSPFFDEKVDWRALFFATWHAVKDSQRYPSLSNRKRIWKLLEVNSALFDLRLSGELLLAGTPISWDECRSLRFDNYKKDSFHLSSLISAETKNGIYTFGENAQHSGKYLIVGSRELHVRSIPPASQGSRCCGLGISVVSFNGQSYVSGIRFVVADALNRNVLYSFSLGFVHPSLETFVDLSPIQVLQGFHVAASVHGIKALRPLVDGAEFPWIGRTDDTGEEDVGYGFCSPTTSDGIYTYAAGFDEFKMVSFGLLERKIPAPNEVNTEQPSAWSSTLVELWKPSPPRDCASLGSPAPKDQVFRCMLNMNFGGVRGEKLRELTRVIVHMDSPMAFISGITFEYGVMPSMHHGRQGALEASFLVDGPGGERIVRAVVDIGLDGRGEFRIQLCTNFGRWRIFMRDEAKAIRDAYISRPSEPHRVYTLDPQVGQTIVGFTSFLTAEGGSFCSFGIQALKLDTPSPSIPHGIPDITCTPSHAAKESFEAGSEIISFQGGSKVYDSAPLEGLKRIRFSRGVDGRPRKPGEISGLRLEYHDSQQHPEILGQWMSEFDSFGIAKGDEVTEIRIWLTKWRLYSASMVGPVVRIEIVTLTGSRGTFQASGKSLGDCITIVFRANRYEKMRDFLWTFSSVADHPRVTFSPISTTPSDRKPEFHLLDSTMEKYTWMVPEKIFWEDLLPDGTPDPVVRISGFSRPVKSKYLVGFSFAYKSGAVKTLGTVDGQMQRGGSIDLGHGTIISRIDILRSDGNDVLSAKFTTAIAQTTTETTTELLPPPETTHPPPPDDTECTLERLDLVKRTGEILLCDTDGRMIESRRLDRLPRSDVLGIWALSDFRVLSTVHGSGSDGDE